MGTKLSGNLYLIFDTNTFLAPPNNYHEKLTQDRRNALEILQAFQAGDYGSLPVLRVRIPWVVRLELMGITNREEYTWDRAATAAGKAEAVLEYLDQVAFDREGVISYQDRLEHQEAKQLQKQFNDKDELVLICCLQVREYYSRNIWLVTNDVRLSARAMRSGIGSLTFCALKHAITLKNGMEAQLGDTFVDERPDSWFKMSQDMEALSVPAPKMPDILHHTETAAHSCGSMTGTDTSVQSASATTKSASVSSKLRQKIFPNTNDAYSTAVAMPFLHNFIMSLVMEELCEFVAVNCFHT